MINAETYARQVLFGTGMSLNQVVGWFPSDTPVDKAVHCYYGWHEYESAGRVRAFCCKWCRKAEFIIPDFRPVVRPVWSMSVDAGSIS